MSYSDISSHDSIIIFRPAPKVLVRCGVAHGRAVDLCCFSFLSFWGILVSGFLFLFRLLEITAYRIVWITVCGVFWTFRQLRE